MHSCLRRWRCWRRPAPGESWRWCGCWWQASWAGAWILGWSACPVSVATGLGGMPGAQSLLCLYCVHLARGPQGAALPVAARVGDLHACTPLLVVRRWPAGHGHLLCKPARAGQRCGAVAGHLPARPLLLCCECWAACCARWVPCSLSFYAVRQPGGRAPMRGPRVHPRCAYTQLAFNSAPLSP